MEKDKTLTIVHSNELVEASYSLTTDEMRLIAFASTKIDSRRESVGEVLIYPEEFAEVYGLDKHNVHRNLVNAIKSLATKTVTIPDGKRNQILPWLARGTYERQLDTAAYVSIEFSKYIDPYLFELKDRFTSVNFEYASRLNTPFSFRLYQWLIKAKNLNSAKEHGSISIILEIEWMKKQAGLEGLYNRWAKFSEKHIQPSVDLINTKTDISVIWTPVKKGRSVYAVKFSYVVETATFAKPIRPRLYRRPKVVKGSHEEGSWMRKNLSLLLSYREELKNYDSSAKLDIKDLERIAEYSSICDRVIHKNALKELVERRSKKNKNGLI